MATHMSGIPAQWTSELQSLARIIFGFLTFRHGMEQVLGFPGAWIDAPMLSFFGVVKLLCLPGGLLMMLGLFTRPAALTLAVAHLAYWFIEPLPQALFAGGRLLGSRGAPSDHLLLPALFFAYVYFAGPGVWSLDQLRKAASAQRTALADPARRIRFAAYSLGILRIVAGFLFIFHGTGKIAPTLDPISLRALAMVLELVGGPLIMLGLFTRPLAFLLSGEMAFAYFMSHAPEGFWGSFAEPNQEAAILFCFLFLFMWAAGPGAFSLESFFAKRKKVQGPVMKPESVLRVLAFCAVMLPAAAWSQSGITGVVRDTSGVAQVQVMT
jgi:putative oxidoreductase